MDAATLYRIDDILNKFESSRFRSTFLGRRCGGIYYCLSLTHIHLIDNKLTIHIKVELNLSVLYKNEWDTDDRLSKYITKYARGLNVK